MNESAQQTTIDFAGTSQAGQKNTYSLQFNSSVTVTGPGSQEQQAIVVTGTIKSDDYIGFSYNSQQYYMYFNVDGTGSGDPHLGGTGLQVNINSSSGLSDSQYVQNALDSLSVPYNSEGPDGFLITSSTNGNETNAYTSSSGDIDAYTNADGSYAETNYGDDGNYFNLLGSDGVTYGFQFANGDTADTNIIIPLSNGQTSSAVAQQALNAVLATGQFTGTRSGNTITVSSTSAGYSDNQVQGYVSNSDIGGSDIAQLSHTDGNLFQSGRNYFTFNTSSGSYYAWYNDGVSGDPTLAGKTGIEVATGGEPDDLASQAAAAISAALPSSGLTATASGTKLTLREVSQNPAVTSDILGATVNSPATVLAPKAIDISTVSGAQTALTDLTARLGQLSLETSAEGALQSRLTIALSAAQRFSDNYTQAASRIQDADVAQESSILIRSQILQQAGAAVLAQASAQPRIALTLLQDL